MEQPNPNPNLNKSTQGAKRQHTKDFDIRKYIADLLEEEPDLTREQVKIELFHHAKSQRSIGDEQPDWSMADYAMNHYDALKRETQPRRRTAPTQTDIGAGSETPEQAQSPEPAEPTTETEPPPRKPPISKEAINQSADLVGVFLFSKIILPSGRTLYDSTREEIIEYNSNLTSLIEKLLPGQTPRQAGITSF